MSAPEPVDLDQPRTLGPLLSESLRIYFRHFFTFVLIGFVVVAPAEAIVSGVGLEQFSSDFDTSPGLAASMIPLAVQALVTSPLIAAMCAFVVVDLSTSQQPKARRAIARGLDAFAPVFVPVVAGLAVEALATLFLVVPLALALEAIFVPTILIPIFFAVRWYFAPQAVVVGKARRLNALRESWDLTSGQGLRVAGILLLALLVFTTLAGLLCTPLLTLGRSLDTSALRVAYLVVQETLATPLVAIVAALLYFDLRTRRAAAA